MPNNISQLEHKRRGESFELLASKFPKRYKIKASMYLRGLMKALAVGDGYISAQIEAVRDNLIAVTATGKYLDRRAGLYGIVRGQGTGVLDEDFQQLIPLLGMSPKQISHIMLQVIDVIYGPYATHANVTAENPDPYSLEGGFELRVRRDNGEEIILFGTEDADDITNATAEEVATAISKKTQGRLIGDVVLDARTGNKYLNIRTSTIGSQGFVQILGGNAQAKFNFPQIRPVTQSITTWKVERYGGSSEMQYEITAGPIPNLKSAGVSRKDLVTIRTDSGFSDENTGTFEVTFVGSNFFRVDNGEGTPETGITQANLDDLTFYNPDLGNILLSSRSAAILETSPRELIVLLPVTSPIVKRTLKGGHHFHQGVTVVSSTTPTTVTVGSTSGFSEDGAFKVLASRKPSKGIVSSMGATTATLINAQNWPAQGCFKAANIDDYFYYSGRSGNQLTGVDPAPPSTLPGAAIFYVERFKYTGTVGSTFTGVFPDPTGIEKFEIASIVDSLDEKFIGSFLFDPTATFVVSENNTKIKEILRQGDVKTLLQVDDITNYDNTGYFVLNYGTSSQEGPIKYLAKVGTSSLIVDPSHVYEKDHLVGTSIRMIRQIGPYEPRVDGGDYAVYTTSTSPARDLLASYLRLIAASGVNIRFEIRIPQQKWEVLPNLYSTDPLATELVTI